MKWQKLKSDGAQLGNMLFVAHKRHAFANSISGGQEVFHSERTLMRAMIFAMLQPLTFETRR
jgi:hypothetical protein